MTWSCLLEQAFAGLADIIVGQFPQPRPSRKQLERCKIISHRGEHSATGIAENTLAAFARAAAAGVWGIEMDLHWTKDGQPVVIHDPDLQRLYGIPRQVSACPVVALRNQFPAIPTLEEVVEQYGGRVHLMIEIKTMPKEGIYTHQRRLQKILEPLAPGADYHLLSLQPKQLSALSGLPRSAFVAVAARLPHGPSRWVLRHRWAGLCGHYALVGAAMVRRHHAAGQKVGIGYARSRGSLYRELNRGIDWIFSNNASVLQGILQQALGAPATESGV